MATLYKRATPSQVRVLRIVEGAIKNACHVHPEQHVSERMARSIAKRAAGTLTAGWPDVLAARASRRSVRTTAQFNSPRPQDAQISKRLGRGASEPVVRRSPLHRAWALLAYEIGASKRAGDDERMAALVHTIRIVAAIDKIDRLALSSSKE